MRCLPLLAGLALTTGGCWITDDDIPCGGPCPIDQHCVDDTCVDGCDGQSRCLPGAACVDGACRFLCQHESDCSSCRGKQPACSAGVCENCPDNGGCPETQGLIAPIGQCEECEVHWDPSPTVACIGDYEFMGAEGCLRSSDAYWRCLHDDVDCAGETTVPECRTYSGEGCCGTDALTPICWSAGGSNVFWGCPLGATPVESCTADAADCP